MLFSVKDLKTGEYDRPFLASSNEEAMRLLDVVLREPNSRSFIAMYPQDFILVRIGDYNKHTGELFGLDPAAQEIVCNLSEIANQYKHVDVPNFLSNDKKIEVQVS